MRAHYAKKLLLAGEYLIIEIMRNPADLSEWLAWVRESSGKSFLLLNDDDTLIKSTDTTYIFHILKELGFKRATVFF